MFAPSIVAVVGPLGWACVRTDVVFPTVAFQSNIRWYENGSSFVWETTTSFGSRWKTTGSGLTRHLVVRLSCRYQVNRNLSVQRMHFSPTLPSVLRKNTIETIIAYPFSRVRCAAVPLCSTITDDRLAILLEEAFKDRVSFLLVSNGHRMKIYFIPVRV